MALAAARTGVSTSETHEEEVAAEELLRRLADRAWRLDNLYTVEDKQGRVRPFKMNRAQRRLYRALHCRNIIPKARQLGFTTFILLMMLDAALFNSNTRCAVIAHDLESAEALYKQKVRAVYDRLPEWLRAQRPALEDRAKQLSFANGSMIRVMTSARSGTVQWLLISEHGKICARYPERAREIRTGALPAVPSDGVVFIESTGEGKEGDFFEFSQAAKRRADLGLAHSALDLKLHFFPWHEDPQYRLPVTGIGIDEELQRYFDDLELTHAITLEPEQKAWYAKTRETQRDEMLREYPSTYDEAFAGALEGKFWAREMAQARRDGRVCAVPYEASHGPVHTWWDLGLDDYMAVWFVQIFGRQVRVIDYLEHSDVSLVETIKKVVMRPYVFGKHVLPFDIEQRELTTNEARLATFTAHMGHSHIIAPSPPGIVAERIGMVRNMLGRCVFDERRCEIGLRRLEGYTKEWDDRLGVWRAAPRHDENSHGASAFGIGAQMIDMLPPSGQAAGAFAPPPLARRRNA